MAYSAVESCRSARREYQRLSHVTEPNRSEFGIPPRDRKSVRRRETNGIAESNGGLLGFEEVCCRRGVGVAPRVQHPASTLSGGRRPEQADPESGTLRRLSTFARRTA